jgi:hypothetical protein
MRRLIIHVMPRVMMRNMVRGRRIALEALESSFPSVAWKTAARRNTRAHTAIARSVPYFRSGTT